METIKKVNTDIISKKINYKSENNNQYITSKVDTISMYLDNTSESDEKKELWMDMQRGQLHVTYITDADIDQITSEIRNNNIDLKDYGVSILNAKKISFYLAAVSSTQKELSLEEKIKLAVKMMNLDKENGFAYLFSTPILKNGTIDIKTVETDSTFKYTGDYLEYYSPTNIPVVAPLFEYTTSTSNSLGGYKIDKQNYDSYIPIVSSYYASIMKKNSIYSDKFINQVYGNLESITLLYTTYEHDWAAVTYYESSIKSKVAIDTGQIVKFNQESGKYEQEEIEKLDFMIDTYTHELGHVFANASSKDVDIDDSEIWEGITQFVKKEDSNNTFLRDYAFTDETEMFAECVSEYYADPNSSSIYNPYDLKAISTTVSDKEISLYDIMSIILGGKRDDI